MGAEKLQQDPFYSYLMPKLKRAHRDRGAVEVLKALASGRSLDNAILDTIESLPQSDTRNLRLWVEEARGESRDRRKKADETAARELLIYLDNESDIYEMKKRIAASLQKRMLRGMYDARRAPAAWTDIVELAAKRYAREYASPREWSSIFNPATRDAVAKDLSERWYANAKAGRPEEV